MISAEENALRDFIISCLTENGLDSNYLYFRARGLVPVQNLVENLIWNLLEDEPNSRSMNQITMEVVGLLPELIRTNFATLDTIDEDADIFLTFSTDLVEDSVENAWSVYKGGIANVETGRCEGGAQVLVASGLDRDGRTVMINSVSNKWNRSTYCLEGSVYTKEGRSKKLAVNFTPGSLSGRPSNVTKITFDDT